MILPTWLTRFVPWWTCPVDAMFDQPVFYSWCSFKSTDYAPGCTVATICFFSIFSIIMGEFKIRCGPCKTKYYQGCSRALFVGNFFSHKRRRQSYSNGLGSNAILVGSFPKLDLYITVITAFFRQGDVPFFWVNLGGDTGGWIPSLGTAWDRALNQNVMVGLIPPVSLLGSFYFYKIECYFLAIWQRDRI